ncbi:hypothetical protein BKA70DRAFT_709012 [Coprinopsis sp. MPI-PUGE-AT-0042]|nr:hypothetical protein BKA70DRAFT_709012 [Coprinopsis sp. MPI-PUGE-AT-0042]
MNDVYVDPVQCLPPEISTKIFKFVVLNDLSCPTRRFDSPAVLTLSQVCKPWRELVCFAPTLWSALRIHDPSPHSVEEDKTVTYVDDDLPTFTFRKRAAPAIPLQPFVKRLSKWTKSSSGLPFHLNVTFPKTLQIDVFINTLLQPHSASRIQSLNLTITPDAKQITDALPLFASNLQHSFPMLSQFSLRMVERESITVHPRAFSRLVVSCSPGSGPHSNPHGWLGMTQQLTKLHLNVFLSPSHAEQILRDASPALVDCTIEVLGDRREVVSNNVPTSFPRLESLTLTLYPASTLEFLNSWEMPVLQELSIKGREEQDGVLFDTANEQLLRQTALEKLMKNSAAINSVTFESVPRLNKDDIFALIRSSHSLSHLTLIHNPALSQTYQQFFSEFTHGPGSVLKTLSLHVAIGAGQYDRDKPPTFPTKDFVQFVIGEGRQMKVSLRLLGVLNRTEDLVEEIKEEIEDELARCGVDERFRPKVDVRECMMVWDEIILPDSRVKVVQSDPW